MNKDITINPEKIKQVPDKSICDGETIRQILLYSLKHPKDARELINKINPAFNIK